MAVKTSEYVRFTWMMCGPLYEMEYFLCVYNTRVPTGNYAMAKAFPSVRRYSFHSSHALTCLRYSGSSFGFITLPTRPQMGRSSTLIWYQ